MIADILISMGVVIAIVVVLVVWACWHDGKSPVADPQPSQQAQAQLHSARRRVQLTLLKAEMNRDAIRLEHKFAEDLRKFRQ